jgi:hypothetical protein
MTNGSTSQIQKPLFSDAAYGTTGSRTKVYKTGPLFRIIQDQYIGADTFGIYGIDPRGVSARAYFVQIQYQPRDKEGNATGPYQTVAGFISPVIYDLTLTFRGMAYRFGVDAKDVQDCLKSRVDGVRRLIDNGGDYKFDIAESRKQLALLETSLRQLESLIDAGWTHFALASGQKMVREGRLIDLLDLNMDFFRVFFPEGAFPLKYFDPQTGRILQVGGDGFLWSLFPEGEIAQSSIGGKPLWNRFELQMSGKVASNFPDLKITFNHALIDIYADSTENEGKLVARSKGWPTVEEKRQDLLDKLKNNPKGLDAKKARREAMLWAYRFMVRQQKLLKQKKTKFAQTNGDAADALINAIGESVEKELDTEIMPNLKNVDPGSKDLDKYGKAGLQLIGDLMLIGRERVGEKGDLYNDFNNLIIDKYSKRARDQQNELKKMKITDADFHKKAVDLFHSNETLTLFGSEDNSIFEETGDIISEKYVDGIKEMASKSTYDPEKMLSYLSGNQLIGETHKVSPEDIEKLAGQHNQKLLDRYHKNKALDKELRGLINVQTDVFGRPLPSEIAEDKNVKIYLQKRARGELREPPKRQKKRHPGRGSLLAKK